MGLPSGQHLAVHGMNKNRKLLWEKGKCLHKKLETGVRKMRAVQLQKQQNKEHGCSWEGEACQTDIDPWIMYKGEKPLKTPKTYPFSYLCLKNRDAHAERSCSVLFISLQLCNLFVLGCTSVQLQGYSVEKIIQFKTNWKIRLDKGHFSKLNTLLWLQCATECHRSYPLLNTFRVHLE